MGGAWHWFCSPVFCTLTLVSFVRVLTDASWPRGTPGRVSPCSVLLTPLCILVSLQAVSPVLVVSTLLTDMAARCAEGWGLSCARAPPSGSVPVAMGTGPVLGGNSSSCFWAPWAQGARRGVLSFMPHQPSKPVTAPSPGRGEPRSRLVRGTGTMWA